MCQSLKKYSSTCLSLPWMYISMCEFNFSSLIFFDFISSSFSRSSGSRFRISKVTKTDVLVLDLPWSKFYILIDLRTLNSFKSCFDFKKKLVTRLPNFPDRRIRYNSFLFKNIVTNEKINF